MAAPTTSRTCLRRLATSRIRQSTFQPSSPVQVSQRSIHTPAPLYLDFLAPSWRTAQSRPSNLRRTNSSTLPRLAQSRPFSTTPAKLATAITNPRTDDAGNAMTLTITPRAAHRLQTISETDSNPTLALRVSVESGGCHGFQYLMSLVNTADIDAGEDTVFENEEVARKREGGEGGKGGDGGDGGYKAKIVIDEPSLELLNGSSIDYTMELIGSQFKVTGIPGAKSSCGCGTSFDIAV